MQTEFGVSEIVSEMCDLEMKRNLVVGLHLEGKTNIQIRRALPRLNLTRDFVYSTIKRYKETGSIKKRYGGGRTCTATGRENVERVRKRLAREPERSARQLAKDLNVSRPSVSVILKKKLKVKPFKKFTSQFLSDDHKKKRLERCRWILSMRRKGELPNLVFSDEKVFCVEQYANRQNDRVWLRGSRSENLDRLRLTRRQGAAQIMVWAAVTEHGRSPLVFLPMGKDEVKINQRIYREKVLKPGLLPWASKQFGESPWTFQQDSAPSHRATGTKNWLKNHVPHFIDRDHWPANSPDLNPLDYCVWGILQARVSAIKHTSLDALKQSLLREWKVLDQAVIRASCQAFERRLRLVVKAKGGHIPEGRSAE